MDLFDTLIGKIAPHNCLGCGADGRLLCAACVDKLPAIPERCYRCQKSSQAGLTCADCRTSPLTGVRVLTLYEGSAKALIWKLKLAGSRAAARIMAERLAPLIGQTSADAIIVPVPTATGRVRQRGYDQARLLARQLARRVCLPYRDCLARHGQTRQHGRPRRQRLTQLASAFRVKRPEPVRGANILLVDDVVTTGATLEAAAAVLRNAGARRIEAIVFARPGKSGKSIQA